MEQKLVTAKLCTADDVTVTAPIRTGYCVRNCSISALGRPPAHPWQKFIQGSFLWPRAQGVSTHKEISARGLGPFEHWDREL